MEDKPPGSYSGSGSASEPFSRTPCGHRTPSCSKSYLSQGPSSFRAAALRRGRAGLEVMRVPAHAQARSLEEADSGCELLHEHHETESYRQHRQHHSQAVAIPDHLHDHR